jgi:hypothetical protein
MDRENFVPIGRKERLSVSGEKTDTSLQKKSTKARMAIQTRNRESLPRSVQNGILAYFLSSLQVLVAFILSPYTRLSSKNLSFRTSDSIAKGASAISCMSTVRARV